MFRIQNNANDYASAKKILYITTAILILLFSTFYKLYQPIKYLGIPETDTWGFAIISDFIAQNHYTTVFADGVYATYNATLQLVLNIPQEYIGIFGGEITFLIPLFFFIIARRCGKNKAVHLLALLIGGFFGLNRTILYAPETFSYIFMLLFIYLSGLFYLLNKKLATTILLFFISWVYILFHQSAISAYFALGIFIIISGAIYRKQILYYFQNLAKRPSSLILILLISGAILSALIALNIFDPLIGQLKFYLTDAAKIASPASYSGIISPPFSELTKNISFIILLICFAIILISKKYKGVKNIPALSFYSSFAFFLFFFSVIYILPRTGFEVPIIWRFYQWLQLSTWISVIVLLSIVVNQLNKKYLATFAAIIAIGIIPSSPEINVQFSGTVDTLRSVKKIYVQHLVKADSILYTQWYYAPSLSFGFLGYSGYKKNGIEIVQMADWGWIFDDNEKTFSKYFISKTEELNKEQNFKQSYLLLSKYLLSFSKTDKASVWLQAMSNANLDLEKLKSFRFLKNIIYEDQYNILFKLPDDSL